ncbi:MAG: aspartate aminotransferase family protein [Acutalibacteraceae bacterium]|nr:aspartate aminotransferase family protein [Acutalibacteraceae bacterium]
MNFEQIKTLDENSAMGTYARFPLAIVSGKGAKAYSADGKEYIDFTSGIGVNSLGYCDDGYVNAVSEQLHTLTHISNLYYNPATVSLTSKLTSSTKMARAFMANSGAEANECMIKLCRKYSFDKYGEGRNVIVTLINSFHGRTMNTLTACGQQVLHPDCFAPYADGFRYVKAGDFDEFESACADNKVCAVIMETIQGEGGVIPLDKEFVNKVVSFANEHDILVAVDDVQAGIGRTGKLMSYEHYGITPDCVSLAKGLGGGLPIGACLCSDKLKGVMTPGTHGSTFGGNPVVCAGAEYVLSVVNNESFLHDVAEKGEYIREKISTFKNVKSVRGRGLMIGIEVQDKIGADIVKECLKHGLITLTAKTLVRLLPPLNISYEEIDRGLEILKQAIEQ